VTGHLHRPWTRVFFVVFRNPAPGQTHVFRKGEAYAQVLLVPERVSYDLEPLTPAQRGRRARLDDALATAAHVATHRWRDAAGRRFDNRYKVLRKVFADGGWRAVLRAVRAREDDR